MKKVIKIPPFPKKEEVYNIDPSAWYADLNNGIVTSENDYWKDNPEWEEARYYLTLKYGTAINGGTTRLIFKTKTGVCKLAYPGWGCANEQEYYEDSLPVARCKLIDKEEVSILLMEWVREEPFSLNLPDWTGYVDGCQVGYNRAGKLVAYDAATY